MIAFRTPELVIKCRVDQFLELLSELSYELMGYNVEQEITSPAEPGEQQLQYEMRHDYGQRKLHFLKISKKKELKGQSHEIGEAY
jgi:hypothetical protein